MTKTLKQIRNEYREKNNKGQFMTDKEQDECFINWLTQERQEVEQTHLTVNRKTTNYKVAKLILIKKLLEELNQQ